MSSSTTASNRRRLIIIVSAVLVFLLFISFKPASSKWQHSQTSSGITPPKYPAEGADSQKETSGHSHPQPPKEYDEHRTAANDRFYPDKTVAQAKPTAAPPPSSPGHESPKPDTKTGKVVDPVCEGHAKTSDVLVVMKTGATEAYDKLPIHFMTTLRCANDTILFSDMEMDMGGHHIIDVLRNVKPEIKKDNPDFKLYDKLMEYQSLYADPRPLKNGGNGWNLDKYKFNHMMVQTWEYRQDPSWYLFIEADTYVVWDNLRTVLDKYDPDEPMYIGSPTYLDIEFAHGGTGYVISRAAMKLAVGGHPDIIEKYDKDVRAVCCGDRFIARILLDEEIKLTKAWPMFNGEKPLTLPYGKDHWCQPLITMHHMTAQEVSQVHALEQQRKAKGIKAPLMIKDVYEHFVKENLEKLKPAVRQDWDNLANDVSYKPSKDVKDGLNEGQEFMALSELKRASVESPQNCDKLCSSEADCYGWQHKDNMCKLSRSIKIGGHMSPDNGKHFVSGWNMDAINKFIAKMGNCPNGPDWKIRGI